MRIGRRVGDVAHARHDGAVEALARQPRRLAGAAPEKQHDQQRHIEHRVGGEGRDRAGGGDDDAADGGAETSRDVVADAVQRHRGRQRFGRHLLADGGLPGRSEQRHAAADDEAERQQDFGRDPAEPGQHGERGRARKRDRQRDQRHDAPVIHVGDGAGRHRDQHDRQHQGGLHQRDLVGGGGHLRHRPGGADRPGSTGRGWRAGWPARSAGTRRAAAARRRRRRQTSTRFGCFVIRRVPLPPAS